MNPLFASPGIAALLLLAACATPTPPPAEASSSTAAASSTVQAPARESSTGKLPSVATAPGDASKTTQPTTPQPKHVPHHAKAKPTEPPPAATPHAAPSAPVVAAAKPPSAAAPPAPPLDLKSLEERLKDTSAIGVLTKLSLKNQVDDLVDKFRAYHQGVRPPTLADLRPAYELLLMKVLSLLQDKDPSLAHDVSTSREAIWGVLTDPRKLAQFS